MRFKNLYSLLSILLVSCFLGCTSGKTINLNRHNFNQRPQHIVWFMVPGLREEHIGLVKFGSETLQEVSSFERSLCFGKMWNFNLFQLRPRSLFGFLSQATGNKNIGDACKGFAEEPIWNIFHNVGYKTAILESGISEQDSFAGARSCDDGRFLSKSALIRMSPGGKGRRQFHYQKPFEFEEGQIFYDRSCQGNACFANISDNAEVLWKSLQAYEGSIFVVRIGDYRNAVREKDILKAGGILKEIEQLLDRFLKEVRGGEMLVLMTSSEVESFEFPERGRRWEEFVERGGHILYRHPSLMSSVWASGAGAENFCGIYGESDVFNRILWRPSRDFFERQLIRIL